MHADEVRGIREKFGWTQDVMAEKVGVSKRTIGNWESGRPIPPAGVGKIRYAVEREKHEAEQAALRSLAEGFDAPQVEARPFKRKRYAPGPDGYLELLTDRLQETEDRLDYIEGVLFGSEGKWHRGMIGPLPGDPRPSTRPTLRSVADSHVDVDKEIEGYQEEP